MQLTGLIKLEEFKNRHSAASGPLDAWRKEVELAQWRDKQDVKARFATASFPAKNRIVFYINGFSERIVVIVLFRCRVVLIDWIGTFTEYSNKALS